MKPVITPKTFSDEALSHVLDQVLPIVKKFPEDMDVPIFAENMFPRSVWEETKGYHQMMGMQVSYLVNGGFLPLERLSGSGTTARYIIK